MKPADQKKGLKKKRHKNRAPHAGDINVGATHTSTNQTDTVCQTCQTPKSEKERQQAENHSSPQDTVESGSPHKCTRPTTLSMSREKPTLEVHQPSGYVSSVPVKEEHKQEETEEYIRFKKCDEKSESLIGQPGHIKPVEGQDKSKSVSQEPSIPISALSQVKPADQKKGQKKKRHKNGAPQTGDVGATHTSTTQKESVRTCQTPKSEKKRQQAENHSSPQDTVEIGSLHKCTQPTTLSMSREKPTLEVHQPSGYVSSVPVKEGPKHEETEEYIRFKKCDEKSESLMVQPRHIKPVEGQDKSKSVSQEPSIPISALSQVKPADQKKGQKKKRHKNRAPQTGDVGATHTSTTQKESVQTCQTPESEKEREQEGIAQSENHSSPQEKVESGPPKKHSQPTSSINREKPKLEMTKKQDGVKCDESFEPIGKHLQQDVQLSKESKPVLQESSQSAAAVSQGKPAVQNLACKKKRSRRKHSATPAAKSQPSKLQSATKLRVVESPGEVTSCTVAEPRQACARLSNAGQKQTSKQTNNHSTTPKGTTTTTHHRSHAHGRMTVPPQKEIAVALRQCTGAAVPTIEIWHNSYLPLLQRHLLNHYRVLKT